MARTRSRFDEDEAPRSDVYTGLLALSLIAMIVSSLLLFLDYNQYGSVAPQPALTPEPARSQEPAPAPKPPAPEPPAPAPTPEPVIAPPPAAAAPPPQPPPTPPPAAAPSSDPLPMTPPPLPKSIRNLPN